jgi:hypothetical protein
MIRNVIRNVAPSVWSCEMRGMYKSEMRHVPIPFAGDRNPRPDTNLWVH